jgi:putative endonuclease
MSIEKSTRGGAPWKLVAYFTKADRSEAMILERKLKNLDKDRLEDFIRKYFKVAVTDDLP